jgi:hypothetical protein
MRCWLLLALCRFEHDQNSTKEKNRTRANPSAIELASQKAWRTFHNVPGSQPEAELDWRAKQLLLWYKELYACVLKGEVPLRIEQV